VSQYNKAFLVERCGPRIAPKLHVVHCGLDFAAFRAAPARDAGHRAGAPLRILCVASFRAVKGHRHLIEAFRLLRRNGVRFECDLVGDGPLRRRIERQVRDAGLGDAVRLRGNLARNCSAPPTSRH
jgi:glycosyltransferase involved in cell wall biosynthesis